MRRIFAALAATVLIAGCSVRTPNSSGPAAAPAGGGTAAATASGPLKGTIGTASLGGDMYTLGVTMSKISKEKVQSLDLTVQTTGGGTENLRLLGGKQVEFGMVLGPEAARAIKGEEPFQGKADQFKNIRGMFAHPYGGIQVVALASSNLKNVSELKGKKISIGAPGSSGATLFVPALLNAHGITKENTKFVFLNAAQAVDSLKNRQVDAIAFLQEPPLSQIANLAVTDKIRLLAADADAVDKASASVPGTYAVQLAKDVYGASQLNDGPVLALGCAMIFSVRDDVPADKVYNLMKGFFEELDKYRAGGILEKRIDLSTALQGMTVPLHPGAEKFLKEKGVVK